MRSLCSIHIFREKDSDVFANNAISESLVNNEPLRAYIMLLSVTPVQLTPIPTAMLTLSSGLDLYTASDQLPRYLSDPEKGASYAVEVTPWQDAVGTSKPRWDWLEEKISVAELRQGHRNGPEGGVSPYPGAFGAESENAISGAAAAGGDEALVPRPEHAIFGLAMLGGGRVFGQAHLYGMFELAAWGLTG